MPLLPYTSSPVYPISVSKGGTGSATQNFVDLTTNQTIAGAKTFTTSVGVMGTYVPNIYSSNLYLNSTAYFFGSSAGNIQASVGNGMILNGTSGTDTHLKINQPGTSGAYLGLQSNNGQYISAIGSSNSAIFWEFGNFGQTDGMYFQTNNSGTSTASGNTTVAALKLDYSQNAFFYGNVTIPLAKKLNIGTGTNASIGTGTLSAGTVTISTTAVTASSLIFLTDTSGSTGQLSVGTKTAGTSFVVNSSLVTDTSTFNWWIIN